MARPRAVIIGAGRMGQGLGLALQRRGYASVLVARTTRPIPPPLLLQVGDPGEAARTADYVIIATPDDAVPAVAAELAQGDAIGRDHVVLHLSGLLDRRALAALEGRAAALGSFHPLQTVADPATAAERLQGAFVGIEGDDRALEAAERLAKTLRMTPVRISAESKPAYHAAATFVANYTAALMGIAERIATSAGIPPEVAGHIYAPLLHGAAQNISSLDAAGALTGAVRRGDVRTIHAHLGALGPDDRRLYCGLGLAALELARKAGLSEPLAMQVEGALKDGQR